MTNSNIIAIIGHKDALPSDLLDPFEKAATMVYVHGCNRKAVAMAGQAETTFIVSFADVVGSTIGCHVLNNRSNYPNIKVHFAAPDVKQVATLPSFLLDWWNEADQCSIFSYRQMIDQASSLMTFFFEPDQEPAVQYARGLGIPVYQFHPCDVYRDEAAYFATFSNKDQIYSRFREQAEMTDSIVEFHKKTPFSPEMLPALVDLLSRKGLTMPHQNRDAN